jgi:hypothetical protein
MNRLDSRIAAGHDERVAQDFHLSAHGRMQRGREERSLGRNFKDRHEHDDGRPRARVSINAGAVNLRPDFERATRTHAPIYCSDIRMSTQHKHS